MIEESLYKNRKCASSLSRCVLQPSPVVCMYVQELFWYTRQADIPHPAIQNHVSSTTLLKPPSSSLQTLLPPQSHPQTETLPPLSRRLLFLRLIRDRRRYAILHQFLVSHRCFSRTRRHRHSFCAADRHFNYPFGRDF